MKRKWSEHRSTALTVSGERQVHVMDITLFSHVCVVCVQRCSLHRPPSFFLWHTLGISLVAFVLETNSAEVKSQAISLFQSPILLAPESSFKQNFPLLLFPNIFKRLKVSLQCAKPEQKIVVAFLFFDVILVTVRNKFSPIKITLFTCSYKPGDYIFIYDSGFTKCYGRVVPDTV